MGPILIVFGERPLVHCNWKRMETLLQALGLVWDDRLWDPHLARDCHNQN
jgi:hypothetical protein